VRAYAAQQAGGGIDWLLKHTPPVLYSWPYVPVRADQLAALIPDVQAGAEALERMHAADVPVKPGVATSDWLTSTARIFDLRAAESKARVWTPLLEAREAIGASRVDRFPRPSLDLRRLPPPVVDASGWKEGAEALSRAEKAVDQECRVLRQTFERLLSLGKEPANLQQAQLDRAIDSILALTEEIEDLRRTIAAGRQRIR
jgi:hypothetical protein